MDEAKENEEVQEPASDITMNSAANDGNAPESEEINAMANELNSAVVESDGNVGIGSSLRNIGRGISNFLNGNQREENDTESVPRPKRGGKRCVKCNQLHYKKYLDANMVCKDCREE